MLSMERGHKAEQTENINRVRKEEYENDLPVDRKHYPDSRHRGAVGPGGWGAMASSLWMSLRESRGRPCLARPARVCCLLLGALAPHSFSDIA